ncbi:branched-chain amino acid aminotransferase [Mumia zhuanghuii]|uniref:Branched-chain-amino-acid aminotransferase n=1 Tax=Mumia zhuanghuii TaxID=2585211 RepID=A0A5C4M4D2_9ACTN|nr:branched-chain amino acid aminotransferase [Mumia zhuanghuii]TNC27929.1 branched-chain amino acid aminotransferase [Mumia zhuanghuii]TNC33498.1 branched-chain amino acid aminotransferase [Mumia zhuanghuii]
MTTSADATFSYALEPTPSPVPEQRRAEILANPGFGLHFTDHMFTAEWTPETGWAAPTVKQYGPLQLDPATAVLHYAQEIFEGLKAYAHEDGSVWTFRPQANAERFQRSAHRLALPELPVDWFVGSIDALVQADRAWVPTGGETSLYLRPFMFASEAFLGVRPSKHVTYCVIASPAGAYFAGGVKPVNIWLSREYARAGAGGTGAAKCGGNYASSLLPQQIAAEHGCEQVVFLDSEQHTYIEELGGMNLYFVHDDGTIVTPASDSILEGITRDAIGTIAGDLGHTVEERRFGIDEWVDGVSSGRVTEVFACGTAAVVTPVGALRWDDGEVVSSDGEGGKVTMAIREALIDLQYGRTPDTHGWMHRVA